MNIDREAQDRILKLDEGVYLVGLALYLSEHHTVVIADPHLGYEAALAREGLLLPKGHLDRLLKQLDQILALLTTVFEKPDLPGIVINGDLKHRFGPLSSQERSEIVRLIDYLLERSRNVVLIEGNHDMDLDQLKRGQVSSTSSSTSSSLSSEKKDIDQIVVEEAIGLGSFWIVHGHQLPQADQLHEAVRTIIIGHEHPAVGLRDPVTGRIEVYKCFLRGEFQSRSLVVQPSFNLITKGSDLAQQQVISPFIDEGKLGQFEIFPISDEGSIYRFGRLSDWL